METFGSSVVVAVGSFGSDTTRRILGLNPSNLTHFVMWGQERTCWSLFFLRFYSTI